LGSARFRSTLQISRLPEDWEMTVTVLTYIFYIAVVLVPLMAYARRLRQREAQAREAAEKGNLYSHGPQSQHPHIDSRYCIGCRSCTSACPEGDVLAMQGGKSAIVNGHKCIGHGLCAEVCPVGAITMVMASPSMSANMPYLTPEHETSVPNLFIVGELGGLALIKNAVNQGRDCIDTITSRLSELGSGRAATDVLDVLIVGAGPAGIAASLRAFENKLNYITIEREEIGGTVAKYPRQKLVMTSPVEFPLYGKFRKTELSKEDLLKFWDSVLRRADYRIRTGERVDNIERGENGVFHIATSGGAYRARAVALALGRAGTPRKLGVKGEELSKVMYRLIEADHYVNKRILVVGGGDSAIEAAMGLGRQTGNKVTLSYRKGSFSRIKDRNSKRIEECIRSGEVDVVFNSVPVAITDSSVALDVNGELREIPNDFVWVFAGGTPPNDFLKKIGVLFGTCDITREASPESAEAVERKKRAPRMPELARAGATP
jgi:thioredoxin reductase/Pyruvate/2-oxoacid:ferredoxin oxidoreductase delta subunit